MRALRRAVKTQHATFRQNYRRQCASGKPINHVLETTHKKTSTDLQARSSIAGTPVSCEVVSRHNSKALITTGHVFPELNSVVLVICTVLYTADLIFSM